MRLPIVSVLIGCLAIGLLLPGALRAQTVEVDVQQIGEGLYMLTGRGGNVAVAAGRDGLFMVDALSAAASGQLLAALKEIRDEPVRYLLNTHWHQDHTGGNAALARAGALIVAHRNVHRRLSGDQVLLRTGARIPAAPEAAWPVVSFGGSLTFQFNDEEIHALHVRNAHSDGDVVVHFRRANVVHTGDIFVNGRYPAIDIDTGGSIDGVIAALDRLLERVDEDTAVIPGHGPLAAVADLRAYRRMVAVTREGVAGLIAAGKTLGEIQRAAPAAEFDERWGQGAISTRQWVEAVYVELSAR